MQRSISQVPKVPQSSQLAVVPPPLNIKPRSGFVIHLPITSPACIAYIWGRLRVYTINQAGDRNTTRWAEWGEHKWNTGMCSYTIHFGQQVLSQNNSGWQAEWGMLQDYIITLRSDSAGVSSTFTLHHYPFRAHSTRLSWDSLRRCFVRLQTVAWLCGEKEREREKESERWPRARALAWSVYQRSRRVHRVWPVWGRFRGRAVAPTLRLRLRALLEFMQAARRWCNVVSGGEA